MITRIPLFTILNYTYVDTKIVDDGFGGVYNGNEIISPCGKCREQIYQLNHDNLDCEILLSDRIVKLKELLPEI